MIFCRGREAASHRSHKPEIAGSSPAPATFFGPSVVRALLAGEQADWQPWPVSSTKTALLSCCWVVPAPGGQTGHFLFRR